MNILKANRWKLPKLSYTNYNKEFPESSDGCFNQWLRFHKKWGGKMWFLHVKHHEFLLDFRMSPWADVMFPNATKHDRKLVKEATDIINE